MDVFDYCGHRGDGIGWPELADPLRRVGFHTQEMYSYCLSKNYACTPILYDFLTAREESDYIVRHHGDYYDKRFHDAMKYNYGVINGDAGILVWDGIQIYDPLTDCKSDYIDQSLDMFFIISKLI